MKAKFPLMIGALLSAVPALAAEVLPNNLVSFEVNVMQEVENDEATATLSKTLQARTAKELANQINPIINKSLTLAKKYPSVQVATGNQNAYPRYDNKGKITGFTGTASLNLKSQNTEELSELISELQSNLVLDDLNFGVSKTLQESSESNLKAEAVGKFRQQAKELTALWNAKDYRLVEAKMNTNTSYQPRNYDFVMPAVAVAEASVAKQNYEVGTSQINYHINGTIQLIF